MNSTDQYRVILSDLLSPPHVATTLLPANFASCIFRTKVHSVLLFLDNGKIIRLHPPRQGGIRPTLLQAEATTPYSYNVIKV